MLRFFTMKKLFLAMLVFVSTLSVSADTRVVQGNKVYIVNESYLNPSEDRILSVYSFPALGLQKELNLSEIIANGYLTDLQVSESGVLVGVLQYNDSSVDHTDEGFTTVTYVDVKKVFTYDTSLTAIAEQVTEDTYSYDYYWTPIEDAVECPDKVKNITKTLKKKKGGKKGGGTKNCSKIKHLDHKSFIKK